MDKLNINDLNGNEHLDYVGKDIFLAFDKKTLPAELIGCGQLGFEMSILCKKGVFQTTIDSKEYKVREGQVLIISDETAIHEFLASVDTCISLVGFNWNIVEDTSHINATLWPMVDYVTDNPVEDIDDDRMKVMMEYESYMRRIASSENALFKEELIRNAVQSELYEYIRFINAGFRPKTVADASRNGQITREFYDILAAGHGRIHSVAEVASILSLTPKYLSKVIKACTGWTPLSHIHEYMMNEINQELRYSDKGIKEIAATLRFPSLAFFGKFVKEHTGLSPTALREKLRSEDKM